MAKINHHRRRLLGAAVLTVAAAELAMIGSADAQSRTINPIKPGTNTSFSSLKQIDAGLLNVGYAEAGPPTALPVILLHGWPYDIYSFVDVSASAGIGGLPGDRPVSARLRHDALSFE